MKGETNMSKNTTRKDRIQQLCRALSLSAHDSRGADCPLRGTARRSLACLAGRGAVQFRESRINLFPVLPEVNFANLSPIVAIVALIILVFLIQVNQVRHSTRPFF